MLTARDGAALRLYGRHYADLDPGQQVIVDQATEPADDTDLLASLIRRIANP